MDEQSMPYDLRALEQVVARRWFALIAAERSGADDPALQQLCRAYLDAVTTLNAIRALLEMGTYTGDAVA